MSQSVRLLLNGQHHEIQVRPSETLLQTLRNKFRLTGAKPGCENGDCGACTVLVNNVPQKACLVLTVEMDGESVTTVEGLQNTPIQRAFISCFAFQCGYCTPGFLVNAHALHQSGLPIEERTIQEWLESNICRCTSYEEIGRAVRMASRW